MAVAQFTLEGSPIFELNNNAFIQPLEGGTRRWFPHFGIVGSLPSNTSVYYYYTCQAAPTNVLKAQLVASSVAVTGSAQIEILWAAANYPYNWDTLALTTEGVTPLTWGAGESLNFKSTKVNLDVAVAPTVGQGLVLEVRFVTTGWDLASPSFWSVNLLDE